MGRKENLVESGAGRKIKRPKKFSMGEEKRKKEGGVFILPIWNEGKKKDPKRQRKMEKCAGEKEKERKK